MSKTHVEITNTKLHIGERWCNSFLVTYPTSVDYNGGIVVDDKWYKGYKVKNKIKLPKGFSMVGIGCGLQMNARPPYATAYLKPPTDKKISKKELKELLAKTGAI